ncbi:hypothetical protein FRB91_008447 [Serendipita sp. 411]|nr:hypothetical protein FRB91_008447 [Serendipita sp. 411]
MASGTHTPSLTALKRHPDLQHLRPQADPPADGASGKVADAMTPEGIETPGHNHHFAWKGIDPAVLNSSLKQHIAQGATKGERRLNDFTADAEERMNPHFEAHLEEIKIATAATPTGEGSTLKVPGQESAPAEETKA